MKKIIVFFSILTAGFSALAQGAYPVILYPNKLAKAGGLFEFKSALTLTLPKAFKSELGVMTSIFADESGKMKTEYTFDGVHLTVHGYTQWVNVLKMGKYLK